MAADATKSPPPLQAREFTCLYDVSWTLHRLEWPNLSNRPYSLLSNSRNRANRAQELQEFLHTDVTGPEADNTFDEKAGAVLECRWDLLEEADREEEAVLLDTNGRPVADELGSGILITLVYDAAKYSVILYGPAAAQSTTSSGGRTASLPLLLTKTPVHLTRRLVTFLLDTFDVRILPLRLPPPFLHRTFESYIDILDQHTSFMSLARKNDFFSSILKDVKITLSLSAPIAPHLRTIDADIPTETVCSLIEASKPIKTSFMQVLAEHLHHHTGMRLPLPAGHNEDSTKGEGLVRLSKIVCNAFALSGDGRFKFLEKARSAAEVENLGGLVGKANEMVLSLLLAEATKTPG